jgi:hypothetical protein
MPAPYSDDLYSADLYDDVDDYPDFPPVPNIQEARDGSEEEDELTQHLSPTVGESSSSAVGFMPQDQPYQPRGAQPFGEPYSANVPRVPHILVDDPSIGYESTAESKAREADAERVRNETLNNPESRSSPAPTAQSSSGHARSESQSSTNIPAAHTPSSATVSPVRSPRSNQHAFSERTGLFNIPAEAPPAYTPSPVSPTSSSGQGDHPFRNYQTFGDPTVVPATMGVPEEARGLLSREPESMGDYPYDDEEQMVPRWRRRAERGLTRAAIKKVLWAALLASIVVALVVTALNVHIEFEVSKTCPSSLGRCLPPIRQCYCRRAQARQAEPAY